MFLFFLEFLHKSFVLLETLICISSLTTLTGVKLLLHNSNGKGSENFANFSLSEFLSFGCESLKICAGALRLCNGDARTGKGGAEQIVTPCTPARGTCVPRQRRSRDGQRATTAQLVHRRAGSLLFCRWCYCNKKEP